MIRPIPRRVVERYHASLVPVGDCLVSTYSVGSHGYTQIGWTEHGKNTMTLGHRVAWFASHGEVPSGLTVDHLCRNRRCGNPDHLRLLTNVENARLNGFTQRTHCPHGHEYTDENTYRTPRGHRRCRQCAKDRRRPSRVAPEST